MQFDPTEFVLREHCHISTNTDGDRFVGIKANGGSVDIYFPLGYQLSDNESGLKRDVFTLFSILAAFSDSDTLDMTSDKSGVNNPTQFPVLAYLNVIEYYLAHNGKYYADSVITYQVDSRGKQDWSKTIKNITPVMDRDRVVYLSAIVRKNFPNNNRLITAINKYCVCDAFQKIGWLYTNTIPETAAKPANETTMISVLRKKLANCQVDNDKLLFKSMIAMLEYMQTKKGENQFCFGTESFEYVWQSLIDLVFGVANKNDYFPHGQWIERYGANKNKPSSALEPDSIMIYNGKYYVLDAKYYRYGVQQEVKTKFLPKSADINKQITYGEYVKNNCISPNDTHVYNAFILPYNKENNQFSINGLIENVAEAVGDWTEERTEYNRIQGIVIDTRYLLQCYHGNHKSEKELLSKEIEKYLNETNNS